ncbi:MAG: phosphonate metabolism transcriptional regulator PhnF [Pseudomonadota bacterium]
MTEDHPLAPAGSGLPIWQQIRSTLAEDIATGRYPPGARLPSEQALAARFGVNRHTVRRAIGALSEAGAVFVRRGAGARVTTEAVDYQLTATPRFGDNLRRAGRRPSRRLLRLETIHAGENEAQALLIPPGAPVVVLEAVGLADSQPISLGRNLFPAGQLLGIEAALAQTMADPDSASITAALASCGATAYARAATRVQAVLPPPEVARHLALSPQTPVLQTEAVDETDGMPVNAATTWFCGPRVTLVVETGRVTSTSTDEGSAIPRA